VSVVPRYGVGSQVPGGYESPFSPLDLDLDPGKSRRGYITSGNDGSRDRYNNVGCCTESTPYRDGEASNSIGIFFQRCL
jgi:hypothetical protein